MCSGRAAVAACQRSLRNRGRPRTQATYRLGEDDVVDVQRHDGEEEEEHEDVQRVEEVVEPGDDDDAGVVVPEAAHDAKALERAVDRSSHATGRISTCKYKHLYGVQSAREGRTHAWTIGRLQHSPRGGVTGKGVSACQQQ